MLFVFCINHSNVFFHTRYSEHIFFKAFFTVCCESPEESYIQVIALKHLILLLTNEGTLYFSTIDCLFIPSFSKSLLYACFLLCARHQAHKN